MKKVLIVGGGTVSDMLINKYSVDKNFSYIIAADNGLKVLDDVNVKPDMIIGDFDTVNHDLIDKYKEEGYSTIIKYNPEKDCNDMELAIDKAIEYIDDSEAEITILGGTGTRIDHSSAGLRLLQKLTVKGIKGTILDSNNRIRLLADKCKSVELFADNLANTGNTVSFKYVSLIPLSEEIKGITTKGLKYNLENADFRFDKNISLGVSNEIIKDRASVQIKSGKLFVIESVD